MVVRQKQSMLPASLPSVCAQRMHTAREYNVYNTIASIHRWWGAFPETISDGPGPRPARHGPGPYLTGPERATDDTS